MALGVSVGLLDRSSGNWCFKIIDVPWWDAEHLRKDDRLRRLPQSLGYEDYLGLISPEEARQLHALYRPPRWQKDRAAVLEERLAQDRHEAVLLRVYEWESGLGD